MERIITEVLPERALQSDSENAALPTGAVVQLPLWAAKIALRIAGLGKNASHTVIIVIDDTEVRYSIDSVRFERVKLDQISN